MDTIHFLACLEPAGFLGVGELLAEAALPEFLVLLRFRPAPGGSGALGGEQFNCDEISVNGVLALTLAINWTIRILNKVHLSVNPNCGLACLVINPWRVRSS